MSWMNCVRWLRLETEMGMMVGRSCCLVGLVGAGQILLCRGLFRPLLHPLFLGHDRDLLSPFLYRLVLYHHRLYHPVLDRAGNCQDGREYRGMKTPQDP